MCTERSSRETDRRVTRFAPRWLLLTAFLVALALPGSAAAVLTGPIAINGGNAYEQEQVRAALRISAFDYTPIAARVTVVITRNIPTSDASPNGVVDLDANLLDAGEFSWGVTQHEMAHEVDFHYFSDADRAVLLSALGGASWWYTAPMLAHGDYGCERFASELSWAFWSDGRQNSMHPIGVRDESNEMPLAAFRTLVNQLLAADGYTRGVQHVPSPGQVTDFPR
ncbi:MAG: hypothetical protein ACXVRA_08595 [Gaiellaceae bacterium]